MDAQLSVADFDALGEELIAIDSEIKDLEAQVKKLNEAKRDVADKIIFAMQQSGKTTWQCGGRKLILYQRATVPTPKTQEEKQAFFDWLRSQKGEEVYWHYMSVNSQALNAFYKEEREIAVENQDIDFKIPGIGEESIAYTVSIRK